MFGLQSSRLTMQAEASNTSFDGLYKFTLVRCLRGSMLGQDPLGTRPVLAWTVRGAWSARCRCLLRTVCRSRVQTSWHHARTCPLNRQGTAAAHAHACFSKGYSSTAPCTPLPHLWGSKTHTQACLHTRAHTHAQTRTHAHAQTQTRAHTHTHTQTHRHTRAHTCARIYARRHTHTHTCICTHTLCM